MKAGHEERYRWYLSKPGKNLLAAIHQQNQPAQLSPTCINPAEKKSSLSASATKMPQSDGNVLQFENGYVVETVVEGNEIGVIPYRVRVFAEDGELFAVDETNSNIVRITPPLSQYSRGRLVAGSFQGYTDHVDVKPSDARFNHPKGITMDDKGNVYVANTQNLQLERLEMLVLQPPLEESQTTTVITNLVQFPAQISLRLLVLFWLDTRHAFIQHDNKQEANTNVSHHLQEYQLATNQEISKVSDLQIQEPAVPCRQCEQESMCAREMPLNTWFVSVVATCYKSSICCKPNPNVYNINPKLQPAKTAEAPH
ncbi:hypothetical protein KIW84_035115 [Lathyrus oleraceus]|uniref:Uncharacterized protein n=1 Tax=Pisum sativum TaxID=3888 RepID=A0A9D4Y0E2_PEA|nr:hypothetical protein KIW84_035115 [Pisum sativum]